MILEKKDENIEETARILAEGKIAVLPTDTVYGFSGIVDESDEGGAKRKQFKTDDKIRSIKGRSESKPLIQLVSSPEEIKKYSDAKIPSEITKHWPGALTVIVPVRSGETVAFRCPGDQWLRKVIERLGAPIYSTSVNRSGNPVIDEINGIVSEFGDEVDLIVDDGDKKGSVPSTLVLLEPNGWRILRQGDVVL